MTDSWPQFEKDTSRNLWTNALNLLHRVLQSYHGNINSFCWSWEESKSTKKMQRWEIERDTPAPDGIDGVPITSRNLRLPFSVTLKHNFQQRKGIVGFFSSPYLIVFSFFHSCRISLINHFPFSSLFLKDFWSSQLLPRRPQSGGSTPLPGSCLACKRWSQSRDNSIVEMR